MSDDDISLLSDDGAETKPVKSNAAPSASTSAPKAPNPPPPAAPAKVNKWLKAAAAIEDEDAIISHALEDEETAVARKKKKKKKKKANDEAYDAAEDEGYEEEDGGDDEEGRLKRAKAVDYLSKFSRGKRKGKEGPNSWAEVDESELLSVADNLIQNINRTQKDDILSQIFASTTTNGGSSIKDPLGMGRFDTVNLRLVRGEEEEEVERRSQHRIVNKWHKGKSDGRKGEEGGEEGGTSGLGFALPPEINPSSESFVPDLYLAQFHAETSLAQLKKGMRNLDAEMSEKGRLLKALIKNNFERFISSKGTIDDIYIKLDKMEDGQGGSTLKLLKAIEQVKATSYATWGDILDRSTKIDKIKSVSALLKRFNNLFGMPSRIFAHEASGNYDQIVREYNRANALIKPSSTTTKVWINLYQEVEKRITECYLRAKRRLQEPDVSSDEVPDLVIFLAQLVAEKLPGTREDDPMRIYLLAVEDHLMMLMQDFEADLDESLFELSQKHTLAKREDKLLVPSKGNDGGEEGRSGSQHNPTSSSLINSQPLHEAARALQPLEDAAEPRTNVDLLMWPGPPEWQLRNVWLPRHLKQSLHSSSLPSNIDSSRDADRHMSVTVSVLGPRLKRRLTPAQASWLVYLTSCSQKVTQKLVDTWTAAGSPRLASAIATSSKQRRTDGGSTSFLGEWQGQVTEITGLARRGIERAIPSCTELIRKVTRRLGERSVEAVAALQSGGPMQMSTELALLDLSYSWQALSRAGCPLDSLEAPFNASSPSPSPPLGLGGSLSFCFGGYTRSLATMLKDAPRLLLEQEDWRVGSKSREGQPSTSLPTRLQSILSSAMQCYASMLVVVSKVNPEPPPSDSWIPIQDGFFHSFEAYCSAAREMLLPKEGETPNGTIADGTTKPKRKSRLALEGINEEGETKTVAPEEAAADKGGGTRRLMHNSSSLSHHDKRILVTSPRGGLEDSVLHLGGSSPRDMALLNLRPKGKMGGPSEPLDPSQRGGRLLIAMSDATVLRTTVLPLSVEMHRALLVGPPLAAKTSKGDAKAKQAAKRASEALGTLISDLLEGYLDIQEAKISEIVAAYLSPLHPSVFHATTTNKWGQEEGSGESRRPKLLTEGLHSIYAHLLKVHTQVFAFAPPMTMRPVWDTMVQCLASELVAGYAGLEVGSTSMDRCMDLLLDLCYLECMWSPLATGQRGKRPTAKGRKEKEGPLSASGHFEASFMALGEVMLAVASSRLLANKGRTGSFSPLERMFQGLPNPASVINRGRDLFGDGLLESIVEENGSLNSKLFSSI